MLKIEPIDFKKLNGGVWAEFDGVEFLVAQSTNMGFIAAISDGSSDGSPRSSSVIIAIAENIIMDWRGLTNTLDEQTDYSRDTAVHLLLNVDGFREFVMATSKDLDRYRTDKAIAIEKKQ